MTNREKKLLFAGVILVAITFYTMVVLPYIGKTEEKQEETKMLQTEIELQKMQIDFLPDLAVQVQENQAKLVELQHCYEKEKTQEEVATYFTKLAEENGLKVISFSQTSTNGMLEERGLELFPMQEVTFTCRGNQSDYISLVDALNQQQDITTLSLVYEKQEVKSSAGEYTFKCLLLMNVAENE